MKTNQMFTYRHVSYKVFALIDIKSAFTQKSGFHLFQKHLSTICFCLQSSRNLSGRNQLSQNQYPRYHNVGVWWIGEGRKAWCLNIAIDGVETFVLFWKEIRLPVLLYAFERVETEAFKVLFLYCFRRGFHFLFK